MNTNRFYFTCLALFIIASYLIADAIPKNRRVKSVANSFEFRKSASGPVMPTSQYRGGDQRLGQQRSDLGLRTQPQVNWEFAPLNAGIHTASKASPAVDETGIYVGTDSGLFLALDQNGKEMWRFGVANASRGIHGTASLDQDTVYYGAYNGRFYAHDKRSGDLRWVTPLGQAIGASPLLSEGRVFISVETTRPPNGFIAALEAKSGAVLWRSRFLGEQAHSSPALDASRGRLFVGSNNGFVTALEAETGAFVWRKRLNGEVKSTPTVVDGRVYVTSWDHHLYALSAETGDIEWSVSLGSPSQSSPSWAQSDDLLIVLNNRGGVFGIERRSGRIRWRNENWALSLSSALILGEGTRAIAIGGCDTREVCGLDPRTGRLLWKLGLKGVLSSVPVAGASALYLALDPPGGLVSLR